MIKEPTATQMLQLGASAPPGMRPTCLPSMHNDVAPSMRNVVVHCPFLPGARRSAFLCLSSASSSRSGPNRAAHPHSGFTGPRRRRKHCIWPCVAARAAMRSPNPQLRLVLVWSKPTALPHGAPGGVGSRCRRKHLARCRGAAIY